MKSSTKSLIAVTLAIFTHLTIVFTVGLTSCSKSDHIALQPNEQIEYHRPGQLSAPADHPVLAGTMPDQDGDLGDYCDTCLVVVIDPPILDSTMVCCRFYDADSNILGSCQVTLPDETRCMECLQWCEEMQNSVNE